MATLLSSIETQARRYLKEPGALADPSAPTITPVGTTGATAYSYKVVAMHVAGTSAASAAGSTATGNATLTAANYNRVVWAAVTNATAYLVYRTVGGATLGLIGVVGSVLELDDTGLTGDLSTAPTANTSGGTYWSSQELIDIMRKGATDLWGAIIDLHQEHFQTVDTTNVTLAVNGESLTGVPNDVFRVLLIEPADTTSVGTSRSTIFVPRDYNSPEFSQARSMDGQSPTGGLIIYYAVTQPGFPVAAPTVLTAPKVNTAMALRFVYIPGLGTLTAASNNPIPGESDDALIAWTIAHARAKDREDRMPDPNWLAKYSTEKQNMLVRMTPRQEQEPDVVPDFFSGF